MKKKLEAEKKCDIIVRTTEERRSKFKIWCIKNGVSMIGKINEMIDKAMEEK